MERKAPHYQPESTPSEKDPSTVSARPMNANLSFDEIRDQLTSILERRLSYVDGDPRFKFAQRDLATLVLSTERERLRELYLASQDRLHHPANGREGDSFADQLCAGGNEAEQCHRILATLLCMRIRMTRDDFQRFRDCCFSSRETCDDHLPLELATAERLFGKATGTSFFEAQYVWCAVVLREHTQVEFKDHLRHCPLPRLSKKPIGRGAFGEVSEVELEHGHIELSNGLSARARFAQKDFIISRDHEGAFKREWQVIRDILRANKTHRHIMSPVAALIRGDESDLTFSLFSPLATCNLREYLLGQSPRLMPDTYPPGGLDETQKRRLLWQAICIVDALNHLHADLQLEGEDYYSVWHLDLKSQNVLVTFQSSSQGDEIILQITDFGLSRMKRQQPADRSGIRAGSTPLFRRRIDADATLARGGDASECLAPEAYGGDTLITGASDIWSMGCILAMILSYMERGPTAVKHFAERRAQLPEYAEWFFTKEAQPESPTDPTLYYNPLERQLFKRKPRVDEWFSYLINDANPADKQILSHCFAVIQQMMLVPNPHRRESAATVHKLLRHAYSGHDIEPELRRRGDSRVDSQRPEGHLSTTPEPRFLTHNMQEHTPHWTASIPLANGSAPRQPVRGSGLVIRESEAVKKTAHADKDGKTAFESISRRSDEEKEAIWDAVKKGKCEGLRSMVARVDAGFPMRDAQGRSPMSWAAGNGHSSVLLLLLESMSHDLDAPDNSGRSPLVRAVEGGHKEAVDVLLRSRLVDVNRRSERYHGWTALTCAARNGHLDVMKTLLRCEGIDCQPMDEYGRDPLSWACGEGHAEVVRLLLGRKGLDISRRDRHGKTARTRATDSGVGEIIRLLDSYEHPWRSKTLRVRKTMAKFVPRAQRTKPSTRV